MKLESLANEILLDLFEFFNGVHLLRAFYGLNLRFNNLLILHFQSNPLDFQRISKTDFDIVCQHHLPLFANHIRSLCLSNSEKIQQIERFFSHNLTLHQFTHLQSLTLAYLRFEIMDKILNELCYLFNLTHLYLIQCFIQLEHIDIIFCLPKLIHCNLYSIANPHSGYKPIAISSSIQSFSLLCPLRYYLKHLLKHMPYLQHLSLSYIDCDSIEKPSFTLPLLKKLKLQLTKSTYGLEDLIQHMPNLSQLTVDVVHTYIDGYQWKKIIIDYVPKLEIFHLRMRFSLRDDEKQIDSILNSFENQFWINEHQWFIRCHWHQNGIYKNYYLYTLPHIFTNHAVPGIYGPFKSTCDDRDNYYSYDRVYQLIYYNGLSSRDFLHHRFGNIRDLQISFPTDNNFLCIFSSLNQLKTLSVSFDDNNTIARDQFQTLLNKAPQIFSLKIRGFIPIDIRNKSIRQLSFFGNYSYFNQQNAKDFCQSIFGNQCEILSISIDDLLIIHYFVNHMKNLRILQFDYQGYNQKSTEDKIITWLQQNLPSTCTISNDRIYGITLWIR